MSETVAASLESFVTDGNTIVDWLGSFWTRIYEDPDFIKGNQNGRAIAMSQVYMSFLEAVALLDRQTVPALHRERWSALVINEGEADSGARIRIGADPTPVIGPQEGNEFLQGGVFKIGGSLAYQTLISYPLHTNAKKVMTCIVDDIVNPSVVLVNGTDFIIDGANIYFLQEKDPFKLGFPTALVLGSDGVEARETLLWACDVLVDQDYVYNYLGYVLGVHTESEAFYTTMLNALWDLFVEGPTVKLIQTGWGAMFGVPTVVHASETVTDILTLDDGGMQVATDQKVYNLAPGSILRDSVVVGAVLTGGEYLSTAIRVYETLNPMKLNAVSEFGLQMKTDIPQLFLPRDLFRADMELGVSANWVLSDIVHAGTDTNGNPKLKFDLQGSEADVDAFWADFWAYCEDHNISCETCFADYLDAIVTPVEGSVYGRVAPLEYFMRYFLVANAIVIVLDHDQMPAVTGQQNIAALIRLVRQTVPSYVYMFVIEQRTAGPEEFDLSNDASAASLEKYWSQAPYSTASYGRPSDIEMTYHERRPIIRWIPMCEGERGGSKCP